MKTNKKKNQSAKNRISLLQNSPRLQYLYWENAPPKGGREEDTGKVLALTLIEVGFLKGLFENLYSLNKFWDGYKIIRLGPLSSGPNRSHVTLTVH